MTILKISASPWLMHSNSALPYGVMKAIDNHTSQSLTEPFDEAG
jgi:hypothetical protein